MPVPLFFLYHLLVVAFMTASAYALGKRLLPGLSFHSAWEELPMTTAIGLGTIATAILLLGLCGLLYRSSVIAVLLACHVVGWTAWRSTWQRLRAVAWRAHVAKRWVLVFLAALTIAMPLAWRALYPPVQFDAIMYHLPAAKAFALSHRVGSLPAIRFVVFPQLNEMLFAAAMLLYDDLTAQLVSLLFFALTCVLVMAWARRFGAWLTGFMGLALWIGSPLVLFLATCAYVEMAAAAFAAVAVYGFCCWTQTADRRWLVVSGLSAGFAAGTKYTGLYFVAAISLAVFLRELRRPFWKPAWLFVAS
ncbi:MAG: glycosyltransferase family 39 protein, partial [Acidobacteriota bacterium]